MRRTGNLFDAIISRENLRFAFYRASRGKRSRQDVRTFGDELESNLHSLSNEVESDKLKLGQFTQFTIFDPKERVITAPCFRERVLHHAIMNVCEPLFEASLISDTYACRVGKGRIAALHRARQFSQRWGYSLKLDMRKYFDSVSHPLLISCLQSLVKDGRLLTLFGHIVASYSTVPGRGLPIGSLTSQHFANLYLGKFDRFVKERLRMPGYVRYMDDCVIWSSRRSELKGLIEPCHQFLRDVLELNVKYPPLLYRLKSGMDFLGCRVFPTHMTLNRRSRRRFRAKLSELESIFDTGRVSERELQHRATALAAFTSAGGAKSCRYRLRVLEHMPVSGHGARTG